MRESSGSSLTPSTCSTGERQGIVTVMHRLAAILAVSTAILVTTGPASVEAIDITFTTSPTRPPADIPAGARGAGTVADGGSPRSRRSNIEFRVVPDPSDRGSFSKVVAPQIRVLDVRWSDGTLLRTREATEEFLRRLVAEPTGSTHTHVPWAQMLGVPSVVADVKHIDGTTGSWHIWYGWPSVYAVYGNGGQAWWFSHWFDVAALRLGGDGETSGR